MIVEQFIILLNYLQHHIVITGTFVFTFSCWLVFLGGDNVYFGDMDGDSISMDGSEHSLHIDLKDEVYDTTAVNTPPPPPLHRGVVASTGNGTNPRECIVYVAIEKVANNPTHSIQSFVRLKTGIC